MLYESLRSCSNSPEEGPLTYKLSGIHENALINRAYILSSFRLQQVSFITWKLASNKLGVASTNASISMVRLHRFAVFDGPFI